jgi:DNA ligase-1
LPAHLLLFRLLLQAHALPSGAPRPKQYKLGDSLEPDVYFKAVKTWEIRCADLSLSSAHKGANGKRGIDAGRGIGLRFPRFLRQRDDKPPTHATSADQIRDMYFDQQSVDSSAMAAAAAAEPEEEDWL